MNPQAISDPVSLVIKACHGGEEQAQRIYHQIAEEHQHYIDLDDGTRVVLNDRQQGEFAARYSSEVEPEYWISRRLKH